MQLICVLPFRQQLIKKLQTVYTCKKVNSQEIEPFFSKFNIQMENVERVIFFNFFSSNSCRVKRVYLHHLLVDANSLSYNIPFFADYTFLL